MSAVSIQNVTFTYDGEQTPALRELTLEVAQGQICGVVGAAGAGKSTLCALAAGFVPQFYNGTFSGQALVDGQNVVEQKIAELVRHVGLVSATPFSQISGARFSVFEEVAFGLENLGLPRTAIIERVEWALDALGISALHARSPFELSGGQQQRLVIASALALRPPVLILDEPTAQLDPTSIAELAELLRELASNGTTILFAEHRLEWTAALAQYVVALDHGQIIADGTPQQVFTNPVLVEHKIGWPRPTLIAARLQETGQLLPTQSLPVTETELMAGLNDQGSGVRGQGSGDTETATGGENEARSVRPKHSRLAFPNIAVPPIADASAQPPTDNQQPIVQLSNVDFAYPSGVEALRGVSFAVGAGERVALLGRNGAGKSTLARHLNGLLHASAGSVVIGGAEAEKATVAQHARTVGIVFQDTRNQLFARSVREELLFGPRNLRYDAARTQTLVDNALDALGLRELADVHPYDLQLAQRRLVAVAAVLTMDTPLLVLDEPTAGLDMQGVARLAALCRDLAAHGRSVIVITHDMDFAYEALERVVLMRDGQILVDAAWNALDSKQTAQIDTTVDLPLELCVLQALEQK